MAELCARNLSVTAAGVRLIDGIDCSLAPGELVVLLGPNGAGKTTLLRTLLGLQRPEAGEAMLDGRSTLALSARERALAIAYLPQQQELAWPLQVRDLVALGRFAHGGRLGHLSTGDQHAVDVALERCDLLHLADRTMTTLSGGEQARVHCARALASEAPLLLADEPTSGLDPRQQLRLLTLLRQQVDQGGGMLLVLHDVALAARVADRLLWLDAGRLVADGPPAETLTVERLAAVYGVTAKLVDGHPIIDGITEAEGQTEAP